MIEDILFRAQRLSDRKWVHGYYVCLEDFSKHRVSHRIYSGYAETDCEDFFGDWDEVDPDTLGVLLGEDGNGNDVYSGDILRSDDYPFSNDDEKDNYYAVAYFVNMQGYLYTVTNRLKKDNKVSGCSEGNTYGLEDLENFEVIGTEHDYNMKGLFSENND
jgi:hypothetical protein